MEATQQHTRAGRGQVGCRHTNQCEEPFHDDGCAELDIVTHAHAFFDLEDEVCDSPDVQAPFELHVNLCLDAKMSQTPSALPAPGILSPPHTHCRTAIETEDMAVVCCVSSLVLLKHSTDPVVKTIFHDVDELRRDCDCPRRGIVQIAGTLKLHISRCGGGVNKGTRGPGRQLTYITSVFHVHKIIDLPLVIVALDGELKRHSTAESGVRLQGHSEDGRGHGLQHTEQQRKAPASQPWPGQGHGRRSTARNHAHLLDFICDFLQDGNIIASLAPLEIREVLLRHQPHSVLWWGCGCGCCQLGAGVIDSVAEQRAQKAHTRAMWKHNSLPVVAGGLHASRSMTKSSPLPRNRPIFLGSHTFHR